MKTIYPIFLVIASIFIFTCDNATGPDDLIGDEKVIWVTMPSPSSDGVIFFCEGNTIKKISDTISFSAMFLNYPRISGHNVVWVDDDLDETEIFFWDGSNVKKITDNDYFDGMPQISGNNIVWCGYDGDQEIFFWDGTTIIQVTDNDYFDRYPAISKE